MTRADIFENFLQENLPFIVRKSCGRFLRWTSAVPFSLDRITGVNECCGQELTKFFGDSKPHE
jgi:hypothetical protein